MFGRETRNWLQWFGNDAWFWNGRAVPYLYLCVTLPAVLLLCFLVPPLQVVDESRHFVRAYQMAQGGWLSEIDPETHRVGGMLPEAVGNFVRDSMNSESLLAENALHTIRARMSAFDRVAATQRPLTNKRFVPFPSAAIYPFTLYIPQVIGIRVAQLFSDKVYVWLYAGRVLNALSAVFLVFFALRAAPQYQWLLMLPAMLPVSLSQIASVSSDAGIIALSIFFVALCIRFWDKDTWLIRFGLVTSLLFLTLGKPVHLALGLLLLSAYGRLGWRRAVSFCSIAIGVAAVFYLYWSYLIRRFMAVAGEDHGQDPSAQLSYLSKHAVSLPVILYRTLHHDWRFLSQQTIGLLGWQEWPLPPWFYIMAVCLGALIVLSIWLNRRKIVISHLILGSLSAAGLAIGVILAAYVLWTPPGHPRIVSLQARYFLPALPILAFIAPPFDQFTKLSRRLLAFASVSLLALSAYWTVKIVDHYYFPRSTLLGKNIHSLFQEVHNQSCPAWITFEEGRGSWFGYLGQGGAAARDFRVILATDEGTILGESDPVLMGSNFPYSLLPGSSRTRWRIHAWNLRDAESGRLWLVCGNSACSFGEKFEFMPVYVPEV